MIIISIMLLFIGLLLMFINPVDRDLTRYNNTIEYKFNERFIK